MNVVTTPYRQPVEPPAPPPPPLGLRLGGAAMIVNALLVFAETALTAGQVEAAHDPPGLQGPPMFGAALFDLALGVSLVRGNERFRGLVVVRIVLGLLLHTLLAAARKDWAVAALQVVVSLSLLGLIVGRAGRARMTASLVGFALYLSVATLGLVALRAGPNFIASAVASVSPAYVHPTPSAVQGVRGRYRLPVPAGWMLHTQANIYAVNPLVDQWLTDPSTDAHVMVVAETIRPDQVADPARLLQVMVDNVRTRGTDFRELRRGALPGRPEVPLADAEITPRPEPNTPNARLGYSLAAFVRGPQLIQVTGFYPASATPATKRSVLDVMRAFETLPMEGLPGNEGGADNQPQVTAVDGAVLRGREVGYTLRVAPGWLLRNAAAVHAENPLIDRWLMVPYEGASLFVVAERAEPGTELSPRLYVEALRTSLAGEITAALADEPLRTPAGEGVLLRHQNAVDGTMQSRLIAVVVTPSIAYRVVAVCPTARFAEREAEMRAMIGSFALEAR